jgi:hypothetical protein
MAVQSGALFISAGELGSKYASDSTSASKRVRMSSYCFNIKKKGHPLFETL